MNAPQYEGPLAALPPAAEVITLYRYFRLDHGLEALQTGWWKVGRIADLNDPFDCRPKFIRGSEDSLPDDIRDFTTKFWGLLSFSRVNTDPVIWSHYADSHRGIVLGFELPVGDMGPHEVKYSNSLPILRGEDLVKARTEHPGKTIGYVIQNGFLTKAPSWGYEKEYRLFVSLESCEMRGANYFQQVPLNLTKVILGARCEVGAVDIERIIRNAKNPHTNVQYYARSVEVRRCQMSTESFELQLVDGWK